MKKFISSILSIVMMCTLTVPAFTADEDAPIIVDYGDGYYLKVSTVDSLTPFVFTNPRLKGSGQLYSTKIFWKENCPTLKRTRRSSRPRKRVP